MLAGTKVYSAAFDVNEVPVCTDSVSTEVANLDCLMAPREFQASGYNPAVMNLADAYTACGWYKKGSRAQEEALCRAKRWRLSSMRFFRRQSSGTSSVR